MSSIISSSSEVSIKKEIIPDGGASYKKVWDHALLFETIECFLPLPLTLQTPRPLSHHSMEPWDVGDFTAEPDLAEDSEGEGVEGLEEFLEELSEGVCPHEARRWFLQRSQDVSEESNIIIQEVCGKQALSEEESTIFLYRYIENLLKEDVGAALLMIWQTQLEVLSGALRAQGPRDLPGHEEGLVVMGKLLSRRGVCKVLFDRIWLRDIRHLVSNGVLAAWWGALIDCPVGYEREVFEGFSAAFSLEMMRRRLAGVALQPLPSFEECFLGVRLPISQGAFIFLAPLPTLVTGMMSPQGGRKLVWLKAFITAFERNLYLQAPQFLEHSLALEEECYRMLASASPKKDPYEVRQYLKNQLIALIRLVRTTHPETLSVLASLWDVRPPLYAPSPIVVYGATPQVTAHKVQLVIQGLPAPKKAIQISRAPTRPLQEESKIVSPPPAPNLTLQTKQEPSTEEEIVEKHADVPLKIQEEVVVLQTNDVLVEEVAEEAEIASPQVDMASEQEQQQEELQQALAEGRLNDAIIAWKNCRLLSKTNNPLLRDLTCQLGDRLLENKRWQDFIGLASFGEKKATLQQQQIYVGKMLEKLIKIKSQDACEAWYWALRQQFLPIDRFSLGWQIAHLLLHHGGSFLAVKKLWEDVSQEKKPRQGDVIVFLLDAALIDQENRKYWLAMLHSQSFQKEALPAIHQALQQLGENALDDAVLWLGLLAQDKGWKKLLPPAAALLLIEAIHKGDWKMVLSSAQIWWKDLDAADRQGVQEAFASIVRASPTLEADIFFPLAGTLVPDCDATSFMAWVNKLIEFIDQRPSEVLRFLKNYQNKFTSDQERTMFDEMVLSTFMEVSLCDLAPQKLADVQKSCPIPYDGAACKNLYSLQLGFTRNCVNKAFDSSPPLPISVALWRQMIANIETLWQSIPAELKDFKLKHIHLTFKVQFLQDCKESIRELLQLFSEVEHEEEKEHLRALWGMLSKMSVQIVKEQKHLEILIEAERIFSGGKKTPPPWTFYLFNQGSIEWAAWDPELLDHWELEQPFIALLMAQFLDKGVKAGTAAALRWGYKIRALQQALGVENQRSLQKEIYEAYLRVLNYLFNAELNRNNLQGTLHILAELQHLCHGDPVTRRAIFILNDALLSYAEWVCKQKSGACKEANKQMLLATADDVLIPLMARRYAEVDETLDVDISLTCAVSPGETKQEIRKYIKGIWVELFLNYQEDAEFLLSLTLSYMSSLAQVPGVMATDLLEEVGFVSCLFLYLAGQTDRSRHYYMQGIEKWTIVWNRLTDLQGDFSEQECESFLAWQLLRFYISLEQDPSVLLATVAAQKKWISCVGYILETAISLLQAGKGNLAAVYRFLETCAGGLRHSLQTYPDMRGLHDAWRKRIYSRLAQQRALYTYLFLLSSEGKMGYQELKKELEITVQRFEEHLNRMGAFASVKNYYKSCASYEVQEESKLQKEVSFTTPHEATTFLLVLQDRLQMMSQGLKVIEELPFWFDVLQSVFSSMWRATMLLSELLSSSELSRRLDDEARLDYIKKTSDVVEMIGVLLIEHYPGFQKAIQEHLGFILELQKYAADVLQRLGGIPSTRTHAYDLAKPCITAFKKVVFSYQKELQKIFRQNLRVDGSSRSPTLEDRK